MNCLFCEQKCCRAGKQKNGAQKYYCKACKKYQQGEYRYKAYKVEVNRWISSLVRESVGIRGIARLLQIAVGTVLRRIRQIGKNVIKPPISLNLAIVEVDELRTFIGRKGNEYWLAYALNKETRRVIDFVVGRRSVVA